MTDLPEQNSLEAILRSLRDDETAVREQAIDRLHSYTWQAAAPRNYALTVAEAIEETGRNRKACLQQRPILEALLIAIDDPSVRVRNIAALMLGDPMAPEAQDALLRHLRNDPSHHVRMRCVSALGWSPDTPQKVQGFLDALRDPHYQVVFPACQSLGKLGDLQAVEPLRSVLSHASWQVRFRACEALVRLQAIDPSLVALLEELNQQPEAEQHNETVRSVNEMSEEFAPTAPKARTTQAVLEAARRALP